MPDITDHDLILEMRGDMKLLQADVREIKDNQKTQLSDHETRIRNLEANKNEGKGRERVLQSVVSAAIAFLIAYFTRK